MRPTASVMLAEVAENARRCVMRWAMAERLKISGMGENDLLASCGVSLAQCA